MMGATGHFRVGEPTEHVAINLFAEGVVRNLSLLRDIERTCSALHIKTRVFTDFCGLFQDMASSLADIEDQVPEEEILPNLDRTLAALATIHAGFRVGHRSAREDSDLRPGDGVVEAYETSIDALNDLFDAVSDYRTALIHHNALKDQTGGKILSSPDEVRDFLDSL